MEKTIIEMVVKAQLNSITLALLETAFRDVITTIHRKGNYDHLSNCYDLTDYSVVREYMSLNAMCRYCANINPQITENSIYKDMEKFATCLEHIWDTIPRSELVKHINNYFPDLLEELEKEEQENVT